MSHLKIKNGSKSSWLIQNTDILWLLKKNSYRFEPSFNFLIKCFFFSFSYTTHSCACCLYNSGWTPHTFPLAFDLSKRKTGFNPGPVHEPIVVDIVALGKFILKSFGFSLSVSFNQCSILIYILIPLLWEGQAGERWKDSKKVALFKISVERLTG